MVNSLLVCVFLALSAQETEEGCTDTTEHLTNRASSVDMGVFFVNNSVINVVARRGDGNGSFVGCTFGTISKVPKYSVMRMMEGV
jgi:Ca2+/H+ antiporter